MQEPIKYILWIIALLRQKKAAKVEDIDPKKLNQSENTNGRK
jgi:hypothetical protein